MPSDLPADVIRAFLDAPDTPEVDLGTWVLQLMTRGRLVDLGRGILADLVALGEPYACVPGSARRGGGRPGRGRVAPTWR
jgi:hypothetical protein